MSDARAIEAVTKTLLQVIDDAVNTGPQAFPGGVKVVAKPPHEMETDVEPLQVNLFLYRTEIASGLRNEDPPDLRPGETANPPLPLVLHYLITPYVQGGKDLDAHRLLGLASRAVHEQAVLSQTLLNDSSGTFSDVSTQLDRIRITWQQLLESDIYSLWSAFQTPYRLSAAFEARVVLIDGRQPPRNPVPVLMRGAGDEGPVVRVGVAAPFPALDSAIPQNDQLAARVGESVHLHGVNLSAQTVEARLSHPLLPDPIELPTADVTPTELRVDLPNPPPQIPAGLWSVSLVLVNSVAGEDVTTDTNAIPLPVAPAITSAMPMTVARDAQGAAHISLTCAPAVLAGQPVYLVVGGRAVPEVRTVAGDPVTGSALSFVMSAAPIGDHVLRLRVGGVDSLLIDRSQYKPRLDPTQMLTVTP
jgi:hypothetical protein